jgi:hypothetical protein
MSRFTLIGCIGDLVQELEVVEECECCRAFSCYAL